MRHFSWSALVVMALVAALPPRAAAQLIDHVDGLSALSGLVSFTAALSPAAVIAPAPPPPAPQTWRGNYTIYNPKVDLYTVYDAQSHDAGIVYFDGTWIAQWDDGTERSGQKVRQSMSTNLADWTPPIAVYSTGEGSSNPITAVTQWQPSLVVVGSTLWSLFNADGRTCFSRLSSPTGKWTNRLLDFSGSPWPEFNGTTWDAFPGNNGIVLQDGSVVVPVTLSDRNHSDPNWFKQSKRDSVLLTHDGGATWNFSQGVTFGNGAQCWEATIWQPDPSVINMIARSNRKEPRCSPLENLKVTRSVDGGKTWAPEALFPQDFALSRPDTARIGARNILVQNDWGYTTDLMGNRHNLSLFFSRGNRNDDFVAGLNFTVGDGDPATFLDDYPQIAWHGDTAVVIYSHYAKQTWRSRILKVAKITPLPDDSSYYIFPRRGYNPVEAVQVDDRSAARFNDDYSSAGIDIDANTPANTLYVSFAVKPETGHRQCIFNLTNGIRLFSGDGRLSMESGLAAKVDCGLLPVGKWTKVVFSSGAGTSKTQIDGSGEVSLPDAPYPWRAYFGDNIYESGLTRDNGQSFLIDLASIRTMVK